MDSDRSENWKFVLEERHLRWTAFWPQETTENVGTTEKERRVQGAVKAQIDRHIISLFISYFELLTELLKKEDSYSYCVLAISILVRSSKKA